MAEVEIGKPDDGDAPAPQQSVDAAVSAPTSDSQRAADPPAAAPSKSPTPQTTEYTPSEGALANKKSTDALYGRIDNSLTSQPMAKTSSAASSLGAKDEDAAGLAPYGTRSRNRPGSSRPNYADDSDGDIEHTTARPSHGASARSTPSESVGRSRATTDVSASAPSGFKASNSTREHQHVSNLSRSDKASSTPEAEGAPEKKKRKYERTSAGKSSLANSVQSNEAIPGMSQFSANPSETPEPPPAKRRRANASDGLSVPTAAAPVSYRKASWANTSRQSGRETNVVTFEKTGYLLKNGKMEADDGTVYAVDDCVYLICEPPGDPYYLCRIMQFQQEDSSNPKSPVTRMLVNWFYRPKDIGRYSSDPRYLFASMQSDESPITSLRGKCTITHRSEIGDFEAFRKDRDTFWFNQLYDRYIHRPYEVIPSSTVINVPENVKKALDERWKYLVVEPARMKELTSAVKLCKRCNAYCAPNDSVDCGVCRNTYHMTCVRPPLLKKPSRGFAWSCGPCSRAQEKKLEMRHASVIQEGTERDEDVAEDEEEDPGTITEAPEPHPNSNAEELPVAQAEIAQAKMWPWRYLGIHCRVEDVLQYDDRAIYPRASSRLGPRHQANVFHWYGRPVELVKPPEIKKKYVKGPGIKKETKLSKETIAALEEAKANRATRPKWVQDEPAGYVARGEDHDNNDEKNTAERLFVPQSSKPSFAAANATEKPSDDAIDEYMEKARALAKQKGLTRKVHIGFRREFQTPLQDLPDIVPTNFLDKALQLLSKHRMNAEAALNELQDVQGPTDIGDPEFTKEETKKFEDGVGKYGSELRSVRKHVKTRSHGEIARFYYQWKKTERGQVVWGQNEARRGSKKRAEQSWQEIANEEDDSAFDHEKATTRKRGFSCKFCLCRSSRQWRRAPNVAPGATVPADPKLSAKDKSNQLVLALCQRCAIIWRRYGIRWEDPEELAKTIVQTAGRTWKKRNDEEFLRELIIANEMAQVPTGPVAADLAKSVGIHVTVSVPQEKSKKHLKGKDDKESTPTPTGKQTVPQPPPREPTPPIIPQPPRMRQLPCDVCRDFEFPGDELVSCKECKLTVHRRCYAVPDSSNNSKWICDTCLNDKNNQNALDYFCVLCPRRDRVIDLMEPPKSNTKKKTDRDREREKLEKELAQERINSYRKRQEENGKPPWPREALKRTTNNNWMHVVCAVWTPEVRFSNAEKMERAEGMGSALGTIPRLEQICKFCKEQVGVVIGCYQCHAPFHVSCAQEDGCYFGFDVIPIKGSRKDSNQIVTLTSEKGTETGTLAAAAWCKEHTIKTIFHPMTEIVPDTGLNLLQTYVRTFKQADLALTGTARKANLLSYSTKVAAQAAAPSSASRRTSTVANGVAIAPKGSKPSPPPRASDPASGHQLTNGAHDESAEAEKRICVSCKTNFALRWWPVDRFGRDADNKVNGMVNGDSHHADTPAAWQCHKCHTRVKLGLPIEQVASPVQDQAVLENPPDFFTATAPPPRQPPLQPPPPISTAPQMVNPLPPYQPVGVWRERFEIDNDYHTQALWNSTVVLHNLRSGAQQRISGREFGTLNDHMPATFDRFCRMAQEIGYNPERNVIMTEDRITLKDPARLSQALVSLMQGQRREVHWRIVEETDPYGYQILHRSHTPMTASQHMGPQRSPVYATQPPPIAPSHAPYPHHHGPPPPGPPPPHPQPPGSHAYPRHGPPPPAHQGYPPPPHRAELAPATSNGGSPGYPPPPAQGPPHRPELAPVHSYGAPSSYPPPPHRNDMPTANPNGVSPYYAKPLPGPVSHAGGSASPTNQAATPFGPRPTTPRDQRNGPPAGGGQGGASSSPSLKNLMH